MGIATDYTQRRKVVAVAPMMDWTDRHCRFFHRLISARALLYTEMVVADAVIHGPRERLLAHDEAENPVAVQLGGSDPAKLADAAGIAAEFGYDEINLNVGCPSDRVQSGTFGACLMREPDLVARCVEAMRAAAKVPVTVKCRIGVDDQDPGPALDDLADAVGEAGSSALWVHARKAWLQGLSPKENREIPPLDYERVHRRHAKSRGFVGINGGIATIDSAREQLAVVDGVMIGRAAYHTPWILSGMDDMLGEPRMVERDRFDVAHRMADYVDRHVAAGGRAGQVTRHMLGLFAGLPGARRWRRALTEGANEPEANGDLVRSALSSMDGCLRRSARAA